MSVGRRQVLAGGALAAAGVLAGRATGQAAQPGAAVPEETKSLD